MVEPRVEAEEAAFMAEQDRQGDTSVWTVIGASGVGTMIEWYDSNNTRAATRNFTACARTC